MPALIGLSIGESFAELSVYSQPTPQPTRTARWYLPRRGLAEGLKDALQNFGQPGEIRIVSSLENYAATKGLGQAPVILVTSGFEHVLTHPLRTSRLGLGRLERKSVISEDHVFGIEERTTANGQIESSPQQAELEALLPKLELLKTRAIGLAFLHARQNRENEERVATFFRERGFSVVTSEETSGGPNLDSNQDERRRWQEIAERAYLRSAEDELRKQLEQVLTNENQNPWKLTFVSSLSQGLGKKFARLRQSDPKAQTYLHLGFEQFLLSKASSDSFAAAHRLNIQPTSPLELGFWSLPALGQPTWEFDPGPMAFGKGQTPTLFDVLYVCDRLAPTEDSNPIIAQIIGEKNRSRILEALLTLSKQTQSKTRIEPNQIAQDLESLVLERFVLALSLLEDESKVLLGGGLASSLMGWLQSEIPSLNFELITNSSWVESECAAFGSDVS